MTYHLYITNKNYSSWSLRPWLLMKVLRIPFTEHLEPIIPGSMRQPQWKAFSPTAHVPCLHDVDGSEGEGEIVLWESLAIVDYLAEMHPGVGIYPGGNGSRKEREVRAWARSATAEMHGGFGAIREEMSMNIGLRVELPVSGMSEGLRRDLERVNELWEEGLRRFGGPYLAGSRFSVVDAFFAPVVLRLVTFVGSMEVIGDERVRRWVELILGMEEVREWVGDSVRETGREPVHDEGSLRGCDGGIRRVLEDLRA